MKKLTLSMMILLSLTACSRDAEPPAVAEKPAVPAAVAPATPAPAVVNLAPPTWPAGEFEKYAALGHGMEKPLAKSRSGMISGTTAPLAVRSGLEALRQGGSAVDAVMTHALAEIVLYAGCCVSHAGFMDLMVYEAKTGKVSYMNGGWNTVLGEDDPASIPSTTPSGRTALVPGFMKGVEAAHKRFGKLPFKALFGPAIHFAEQGHPLPPFIAGMVAGKQAVLSRRPETKAVFTDASGNWVKAGEPFRQLELAATLRAVSEQGADYMYRGPWAEHLVAAVQSEGGKMTLEDLNRYDVIWSDPIRGRFREYDIYASSPPNLGGVNLIEALNLVEEADLRSIGLPSESAEVLFKLMRIDRVADIKGTSLTHNTPDKVLLDRYAPGVALSNEARLTKPAAADLWKRMQTAEWNMLNTEIYTVSANQSGTSGHSDAVVAVDAEGNAAALLHTINTGLWGDTGIFVDGIPIADAAKHQQNKIAAAGPGQRLQLETNPIMAFKDGKPVLVSSSIGMGVHEQTFQSMVNVLEYGMDPKAALDAPQFARPVGGGMMERMTGASIESPEAQVVLEGEFAASLLQAVRDMGQPVKEVPAGRYGNFTGYWVGIGVDPQSGERQGASDKTLDGYAIGE